MAYESGGLWPYSAIRMVRMEDGRRSGQCVGGKKVVVVVAEAAGIECARVYRRARIFAREGRTMAYAP